ncbi:Uma2 family endonuclease [Emticicia sp. W12TSBA100-4]|uniref:Uma2 family endonuclease n=1 Tax=Emticicia sp. W12TSBA100-4 TaxID=3160965 RepID=UPI00330592ED
MVISENINQLPRTLDEFIQWEPKDGFKYEWYDGKIIKFEGMNKKHLRLIRLLNRLFSKTKAYQDGGELIAEQDVKISAIQLRRPDLAYFSASQIDESWKDEEPIPAFAIEIISTFDQINQVKMKLTEYFKNGVRVVWLIYPDEKIVEIYTSRKAVKIYSDTDICSASPVLDDFEISVEDLFKNNI